LTLPIVVLTIHRVEKKNKFCFAVALLALFGLELDCWWKPLALAQGAVVNAGIKGLP